ncbi:hypothetical protein LCGC14_1854730 [marine sediment metagenome]|uniref:Uncharacterized protein n=1 Tax=marine sediment metagenome TaxID=412755 RepID=A0A0F9GXL1_9ZZZZ
MKCPKCKETQVRCGWCGYPHICDWCKKEINHKHKYEYRSFHGKPPYPFNKDLSIKQLMSKQALWWICKKCFDRIDTLSL